MKENFTYPITVLSMCYNKAATINRLYESLRQQTCFDFEWLIVNDGSTDNVSEIVKGFKEDLFPIRYVDKENEGAGRTWNKGVELSNGELIFRVDPDDFVLPVAIKTILDNKHAIEYDPTLCGMVFLSVFDNGEIVGVHPYKENKRSNFFDYRAYDKAEGDRAEVVKRSVFKEFPWPSFDGEKFCLEGLMWYPMAQKYDALYINTPIYVREYTTNSITGGGVKVYINNPVGHMHVNMCKFSICKTKRKTFGILKMMLVASYTYYRMACHAHVGFVKSMHTISFPWNVAGFPIGRIMYFLDKNYPNALPALKRFFLNYSSKKQLTLKKV